jgi:tripartite-type tricarboxylate transporter receptor subunit TctC
MPPAAPASPGMLAGTGPCGFLATPVVGPFVRDGKLVGLAVSGTKRTASLPNVPTAVEAGVAGYDASFYETVWAPRATPRAVIDRLQQEIARALNGPDTVTKLAGMDLEVVASRPADAERQMRADLDKWAKVSERIKLQLD